MSSLCFCSLAFGGCYTLQFSVLVIWFFRLVITVSYRLRVAKNRRYSLGRRKYFAFWLCTRWQLLLSSLPADCFFNGMLVINIVSLIFLKEPCYSLGEVNVYTECSVVRVRFILRFPFHKVVDWWVQSVSCWEVYGQSLQWRSWSLYALFVPGSKAP